MRFKRILLVSPKFYGGTNRLSHFPLAGLGYIAEALKKSEVNIDVFDMNLGYTFRDLECELSNFNPDLIGFTAMTLGYKKFYDDVNRIKCFHPELKIVLGGAHISAVKETVLQDCPGIDYGITLEGDISMAQLCQGEKLDLIQGLIYRDNGKIISNKFNNFIENLDELPFPKYEFFELDKYPLKQMPILTSRGCPYNCIYCSTEATIGKKFRTRSAQSIVDEIEYWYNRGYREIFIIDDNFTLIYKRTQEVCELLSGKNFKDLHLKLTSGIRADRVDKKMLKMLKDAGFDYLAFGVESASDKVLKNIRKGESIAVIEKRIKEACDIGLSVDLFFLIGSPGETMDDLKMSFSLALRYPVRRVRFYNLLPLPSTELLRWLNENSYLTQPLDYILNDASYYNNQPCFSTPEMSLAQRKKAFKLAQEVTFKVRRKFIENRIKGPYFIRRLLSKVYALPVIEDKVLNNRLMLVTKEKIKALMVKNQQTNN